VELYAILALATVANLVRASADFQEAFFTIQTNRGMRIMNSPDSILALDADLDSAKELALHAGLPARSRR
jgi:hypothetical protein